MRKIVFALFKPYSMQYSGTSSVHPFRSVAVPWKRLGTPRAELLLQFTLPTGQSFRWKETGVDEYTGVIGQRLVCASSLNVAAGKARKMFK